jgi:hypothetical protein
MKKNYPFRLFIRKILNNSLDINIHDIVSCYSRTGNTRKIAEELANALGCDIEEIIDTKNGSGKLAYLVPKRCS